jgi:putative serine protease PepD
MARRKVEVVAALVIGVALGAALHVWGVGAASAGSGSTGVAAVVAGQRVERFPGVSDRVAAAALGGVLWVEAAGCGTVRQASATVVRDGDELVVLTNAHVVRGSGTASVRLPGGDLVTAQVLGSVPGRDAAVLGLPGGRLPGLMPASTGPIPSAGDSVVVAGHPDGVARTQRGRVLAVERRVAFGGSSDVVVVGAEVGGGSSGGAVFDDDGRVVGLVAAREPGSGWAVAYPIDQVLMAGLDPIPPC